MAGSGSKCFPVLPFLFRMADWSKYSQLLLSVFSDRFHIRMFDYNDILKIRYTSPAECLWKGFPEDVRRTIQVGIDHGSITGCV